MISKQRKVWEEIFTNEPYSLPELCKGDKWVSVEYSPLLSYLIKNINYADKILEAGCGRGQWVIYLQNKGYKIVGVDFATSTMRKTKISYPDIDLVGGDINQLCFNDDSFNVILCWSVLDHIESGPLNALKELYRITKSGGFLFITIPCRNLFHIFSEPIILLKKILRKNKLLRRILRKSDSKKDFFQNEFTVQEFRRYLRTVGFEVKDIQLLGYEAGFVNAISRIAGGLSNFFYRTSNGRWLGLTKLGNLICRSLKEFSRLLTPDEVFYWASK